jgi:hypothetical protein
VGQPLAQISEQFQRAGHVTEQPTGQGRRITRFAPCRQMLLSSHAAQATVTGKAAGHIAVLCGLAVFVRARRQDASGAAVSPITLFDRHGVSLIAPVAAN